MIEIRRLDKSHDREEFCCGVPALDEFFRRHAGQNQFKHRASVTYVALVDGKISGFATIAAGAIGHQELASRQNLPKYPLPILRLARLAVDTRSQNQGVSKKLIRFALELARKMSDEMGCIGVVVDPKDGMDDYYRSLGFEPLVDSQAMFLAIAQIPERPVQQPLMLADGSPSSTLLAGSDST